MCSSAPTEATTLASSAKQKSIWKKGLTSERPLVLQELRFKGEVSSIDGKQKIDTQIIASHFKKATGEAVRLQSEDSWLQAIMRIFVVLL